MVEIYMNSSYVNYFLETKGEFIKSKNYFYGYPAFVHHDKLYSPKKNDVVFLCCRVVRESSAPIIQSEFRPKLYESYQLGLVGECTLDVSGKQYKVSPVITKFI